MILTESIIRQASREAKEQHIFISESTMHFDAAGNYDLFISHCFSDKELIGGLFHLFDKAGYKVYIDWIEPESVKLPYKNKLA